MIKATAAGENRDESDCHRIAIIDQGVLIQDLFKRGLELASGFEVITAATVEQWLDDTNDVPVQLILICLRPGQSAVELQEKMQALTARQDCPVAVLADRDIIDAVHVAWLLQQGAQGFISTDMPLEAAVHVLRMVGAGGLARPQDTGSEA